MEEEKREERGTKGVDVNVERVEVYRAREFTPLG